MSAVVTVGADTTPAQGEVASFLEDVDSSRADLFVGADTRGASEQAAGLAEEISGLSADLSIGASGGGIAELEGELEGVEGAAGTAAAAISGLTSEIDGASGAVPVLSDEISGLNNQLDALGAGFGAGLASHLGDASGLVSQLAADLEGAVSGAGVSVPVTPDMTGFGEQIAAQAEEIAVSVHVIPDMTDFTETIDEQLAGGVMVPVFPDAAEFTERLQEQIAGTPVIVDVATGDAGAGASGAAGDVGALGAEIQGLGDASGPEEAASGLHDVADAAKLSDEAVADLAGQINQLPEPVAAVEGFDELMQASAQMRSDVAADLTDLESRAELFSASVGGVEQQFLSMAEAGQVDEETVASLTARFEDFRAGAESAANDLASLQSELASGDFESAQGAIGEVGDSLRLMSQDLALTRDEVESLAGALGTAGEEAASFRDLTADSFGSVDYTQLASTINGVAEAEAEAAAEAQSVRGDFADLGAELTDLSGELVALDQQFLAFAADGGATDATLLGLSERLETLYAQFGAVGAELEAMTAEFGEAGADISGADAQLGLASTMLRELESDLAETTGAVNEEAAAFFALQEQAARLGVSLEELPAALQGMDAQLVASGDARAESLAALNTETAEVARTEDTATGSANRMGGAFGFLSGAMDAVMTNPFTWVAAAAAGGIALGVALDGVTDGIDQQIEALQRQDNAVGYNISGYQELAAQLGDELKTTDANADAQENLSTHMGLTNQQLGHAYAAQSALTGAQRQALAEADNLSTHLGTLESAYGLTQVQAEQLATAAGVSSKTLAGSGEAANQAMTKIENYANANMSATGPVGQLTSEMETFDNEALTATSRISGLDSAFETLTGNFVSGWQSQLQVTQDFQALASNASQAGASMKGTNTASTQLQTSFAALPSAIEQTANAMTKQGDSVTQVNAYIDEQISKLSGLTGGNADASQAVQGLKEWEDKLGQSMDSQDAATTKAADDLQGKFTSSVEDAGLKSSTAKTDVDQLTESIVATGEKSDSTEAARAQLISDLEKAGVGAQQATRMVDGFITSIGNIPSSKQVSVAMTATGTWSVQQAQSAIERGPGAALVPGHAGGGLIHGGSGSPRADDILIRASRNEYMVQADAVDHYGVGMMDAINARKYAAGGLVGSYSGPLGGLGPWTDNQYSSSVAALTQELEGITSQGAANASAAAQSTGSGRAPVNVYFQGTQFPNAEQMAEIERWLGMALA